MTTKTLSRPVTSSSLQTTEPTVEGPDSIEQFVSLLGDLSSKQTAYNRGESRREPRYPANDRAMMKVLSPEFQSYIDVQVLDVSKHGMKMMVPGPLHPGTILQVRLGKTFIQCEVRYCVQVNDVFQAGVLILKQLD